jgi:integrase
MPDGAGVIVYEGKRGRVFRVKFRDAGGRQVMETLGRESEGWTRKKAEEELRARLVDVKRDGLRRAEPTTFETFARGWLASYPDAKGLKRSTREGYKTIAERHLIPAFEALKLEAIDVRKIEEFVAAKRRDGLAPRTINRQLNLLGEIIEAALRRQLVRLNPVRLVDRPSEPRRRWKILSPLEVGRVERAFRELAQAADDVERPWIEQARVVFLTIMGAGLRRGEILGLRWGDVDLADPEGALLRVRETWVRGAPDTPKSEAGERTIALGPALAEELWQHRRRSRFAGDDERVFVHPEKGSPVDHKRYAKTLRAVLAKAKIEGPMRPFHDGRHTSITNSAAAGFSPAALMARAGHSDFATTQLYIDLAGEQFREEAELLERRLYGAGKSRITAEPEGTRRTSSEAG